MAIFMPGQIRPDDDSTLHTVPTTTSPPTPAHFIQPSLNPLRPLLHALPKQVQDSIDPLPTHALRLIPQARKERRRPVSARRNDKRRIAERRGREEELHVVLRPKRPRALVAEQRELPVPPSAALGARLDLLVEVQARDGGGFEEQVDAAEGDEWGARDGETGWEVRLEGGEERRGGVEEEVLWPGAMEVGVRDEVGCCNDMGV